MTATMTRNDYFNEIVRLAENNDEADRLKAASMILRKCGDDEMADTLKKLSGQLDFDGNVTANDAINRTRTEIDGLISRRRKQCSSMYIEKLTDDEILELSNGEVTEGDYSDTRSEYIKNGLFDPDIFGGSGRMPYYDDEQELLVADGCGNAFGHIELPCRMVLRNDYHIIHMLLGISSETVEKIARYALNVVIDPGKSDYHKGDTLKDAEAHALNPDDEIVLMTGADALYELLKDLNYPDKPERLAFKYILVAPPSIRPVNYSEEDDRFYEHKLSIEYNRIVLRCSRVKKLAELNAPEIIMRSEMMMLEQMVDALYKEIKSYMKRSVEKKNRGTALALALANRRRVLSFAKVNDEKTSDIESLNVYPEKICLADENNEVKPVEFDWVINECRNAMYDYSRENTVIGDDDELSEDEKALAEKAGENYDKMQEWENEIFRKAKELRGRFVVVLDKELKTYRPLK